MDFSLLDKKFDNTVGVNDDGQFEVDEVATDSVVKTVEKDEDLNNNDDEDNNKDNNNSAKKEDE